MRQKVAQHQYKEPITEILEKQEQNLTYEEHFTSKMFL